MFLFYFSAGLAIFGTLLYHVAQKMTPGSANPALALAVTYGAALVIVLGIYAVDPAPGGLGAAFHQLNWTSLALALALVALEVGFLLAYRAGWNLSLATIFVNSAGTLLLVPVGLLLFKEKLSPINLLGILVCVAGLVMMNWKK